MKLGSLYKPCCMRAVPHPKVFLNARMDSSTSTVTLLALGSLSLSLKDSLPTCLPRPSHRYTVCLVVSNSSAIRATVNPFFKSFLKTPSNVGRQPHNIRPQNIMDSLAKKCHVRNLTLHILKFYILIFFI